jgi:hypothetical protein
MAGVVRCGIRGCRPSAGHLLAACVAGGADLRGEVVLAAGGVLGFHLGVDGVSGFELVEVVFRRRHR